MNPLGVEVFADLCDCDPVALNDEETIRGCMLEAARRCGATIIAHNFHRFSPHGISGMVLIAESHLAIHTWPEHGYAALDLFTCGRVLRPEVCFSYLKEVLRGRYQTIHTIPRGAAPSIRADSGEIEAEWTFAHRECVGPGRELVLKRKGAWLFEGTIEPPFAKAGRQLLQIGQFAEFGRGLVIAGRMQLAEGADAQYTAALIFPAALLAATPRHWLILGRGDGPAVREALRFRTTESVKLISPCRTVLNKSQQFIPSFWQGCQQDPRFSFCELEAQEYLSAMCARDEQADVLIYEPFLSSPSEYQSVSELFTEQTKIQECLQLAAKCIAADGIVVLAAQELSDLRDQEHRHLRAQLKNLFQHVHSYRIYVELFGGWKSFLIASQKNVLRSERAVIQERLPQRYAADFSQIYSADWHEQLFTLAPAVRQRIEGGFTEPCESAGQTSYGPRN